MRIWSLHPQYLDPQGLLALWREALLGQKVLKGETSGYRHHPQLIRFQQQPDPVAALAGYLAHVHQEATRRGYRFDGAKIAEFRAETPMPVTQGQMTFEWEHLLKKLRLRSPALAERWQGVMEPLPHPLYYRVAGAIAHWEKV